MAFRPSDFTQVWADVICEKLACGESLRSICRNEEFPDLSTVMRWLSKNPAFQSQYARAREIQAEAHLDELIEIADDGRNDYMEKRNAEGEIIGWRENGEWVNRSRLRVDARKWAISKMAPKKYGDKTQVEHTGTVATVDLARLAENDLRQLESIITVASLPGGDTPGD